MRVSDVVKFSYFMSELQGSKFKSGSW